MIIILFDPEVADNLLTDWRQLINRDIIFSLPICHVMQQIMDKLNYIGLSSSTTHKHQGNFQQTQLPQVLQKRLASDFSEWEREVRRMTRFLYKGRELKLVSRLQDSINTMCEINQVASKTGSFALRKDELRGLIPIQNYCTMITNNLDIILQIYWGHQGLPTLSQKDQQSSTFLQRRCLETKSTSLSSFDPQPNFQQTSDCTLNDRTGSTRINGGSSFLVRTKLAEALGLSSYLSLTYDKKQRNVVTLMQKCADLAKQKSSVEDNLSETTIQQPLGFPSMKAENAVQHPRASAPLESLAENQQMMNVVKQGESGFSNQEPFHHMQFGLQNLFFQNLQSGDIKQGLQMIPFQTQIYPPVGTLNGFDRYGTEQKQQFLLFNKKNDESNAQQKPGHEKLQLIPPISIADTPAPLLSNPVQSSKAGSKMQRKRDTKGNEKSQSESMLLSNETSSNAGGAQQIPKKRGRKTNAERLRQQQQNQLQEQEASNANLPMPPSIPSLASKQTSQQQAMFPPPERTARRDTEEIPCPKYNSGEGSDQSTKTTMSSNIINPEVVKKISKESQQEEQIAERSEVGSKYPIEEGTFNNMEVENNNKIPPPQQQKDVIHQEVRPMNETKPTRIDYLGVPSGPPPPISTPTLTQAKHLMPIEFRQPDSLQFQNPESLEFGHFATRPTQHLEELFPYAQTHLNQYIDPLGPSAQRFGDPAFGGDIAMGNMMNFDGGYYGQMMGYVQSNTQLSPMNAGARFSDFSSHQQNQMEEFENWNTNQNPFYQH